MNTDATRNRLMNVNSNDVGASKASARKENIKANTNRVSWRQKSDNPHGKSDENKNNSLDQTTKEHETLLTFLELFLE